MRHPKLARSAVSSGLSRGIALALGGVLLAACGSGDDADDPTSESIRTAAVIEVVVPPGVSQGFVGAVDDVGDFVCERTGDTWKVTGDITNPTGDRVSYRIYTSFLDPDRRTLGLVQVDLEDLVPGATAEWSGALEVSAPNVECVLRVERTPLGS